MAEFLEAARLTIVIRGSRVDSMVRWPYLEAELIRRVGPHEAALATAGSASAAATSGGP